MPSGAANVSAAAAAAAISANRIIASGHDGLKSVEDQRRISCCTYNGRRLTCRCAASATCYRSSTNDRPCRRHRSVMRQGTSPSIERYRSNVSVLGYMYNASHGITGKTIA